MLIFISPPGSCTLTSSYCGSRPGLNISELPHVKTPNSENHHTPQEQRSFAFISKPFLRFLLFILSNSFNFLPVISQTLSIAPSDTISLPVSLLTTTISSLSSVDAILREFALPLSYIHIIYLCRHCRAIFTLFRDSGVILLSPKTE